jgi:hypothetical protein
LEAAIKRLQNHVHVHALKTKDSQVSLESAIFIKTTFKMDHIKNTLTKNKNPQKIQKLPHGFPPKKIKKRPQTLQKRPQALLKGPIRALLSFLYFFKGKPVGNIGGGVYFWGDFFIFGGIFLFF